MQDKNIELEKTRTQKSRAADTVERVGKLFEKGVSLKTIASQLTDNSRDGHAYTAENVEGIVMAWKDSKSTVGLTLPQTDGLLLDQKYNNLDSIFEERYNNQLEEDDAEYVFYDSENDEFEK